MLEYGPLAMMERIPAAALLASVELASCSHCEAVWVVASPKVAGSQMLKMEVHVEFPE